MKFQGLVLVCASQIMIETGWKPFTNKLAKQNNHAGIKYDSAVPGASKGISTPDEGKSNSDFAAFKDWNSFCGAMDYFYSLKRYDITDTSTITQVFFKLGDGMYASSPLYANDTFSVFQKIEKFGSDSGLYTCSSANETIGSTKVDSTQLHKLLTILDANMSELKATSVPLTVSVPEFLRLLIASEHQKVPLTHSLAPENRRINRSHSLLFSYCRLKQIDYMTDVDATKVEAQDIIASGGTNKGLISSAESYLGRTESTYARQSRNTSDNGLSTGKKADSISRLKDQIPKDATVEEVRNILEVVDEAIANVPYVHGILNSNQALIDAFYKSVGR